MVKVFEILLKPQEASLKLQTIRSAFWGFLGKGSSEFFRLLGNLILTRLLFPEAFGLMALANSTLMMINLFSDTGIKTAIIQNPKGESSQFLNTAWIISILRGILLCVIMIILAQPLSIFYKEPGLKTILLIMAINPLIGGFENPSLSLFIKKFRVDKLVFFELSLQIAGLLTTIILTYIFRCVEVMAVSVTLSVFYRSIGSYVVSKPFPKFRWDKESGTEIFNFGKFIFINTMITWLAGNIDIIVIGKFLGVGTLAFFNIGKSFAYLIYNICIQIMAQSYFPAITSIHQESNRVMKIYKSTTSFFIMIGIPIAICLSIFAREIIQLLYDPRYETAYISMSWLSLFIVFRLIGGINGATLVGIGKPSFETLSNLFGFMIAALCLTIGIYTGGLEGAAIGISISFLFTAIIQSISLYRIMRKEYLIVLYPWIQTLTCVAIIFPIFLLLRRSLLVGHNYQYVYMIIFTAISIIISLGVYKLFKNMGLFLYSKGIKTIP